MKKLFFIIGAVLTFNCYAQWQQTNGPYGGYITCLAVSGSNIFAGTFDCGVFMSSNNGNNWTYVSTGLTNTYPNLKFHKTY